MIAWPTFSVDNSNMSPPCPYTLEPPSAKTGAGSMPTFFSSEGRPTLSTRP
ncbi:hypothetical protein [Streptomyces sp. NPDC017520]|uniref:hypothetical protein n=1 Tax=Streptomyces sp. NPDC017520 TaxID=3364998 RepID=UPI003799D448